MLNVTSPRPGKHRQRPRPVLVWLHGGGLDSGGARRFDGDDLAVRGDVVVVTVNYRLGALGFLSTPALGRDSGNYGLMDQAAALRWVRRNIARFGGDKDNITLAGQSGGARSICAHLASPQARGLFHRAILQSGSCDNDVLTREAAHAFGRRTIDVVGCAGARDVAACLRSRPVTTLVEALDGVGFTLTGRVHDRPWNPVIDTAILPGQPRESLRAGTGMRVPLLLGATRHEMRGFVSYGAGNVSAEAYEGMVRATFGVDADRVLTAYPAHAYERPALALAAVLTDWGGQIGTCPVLRDARSASLHQAVYAYEFAEAVPTPPGSFPLGAYHGVDLPYLWDLVGFNPYPPLSPPQERLSALMTDYWAAFARTGSPNGAGRPPWPRHDAGGKVMGLSAGALGPTPFGKDHHCGLWGSLAHRS